MYSQHTGALTFENNCRQACSLPSPTSDPRTNSRKSIDIATVYSEFTVMLTFENNCQACSLPSLTSDLLVGGLVSYAREEGYVYTYIHIHIHIHTYIHTYIYIYIYILCKYIHTNIHIYAYTRRRRRRGCPSPTWITLSKRPSRRTPLTTRRCIYVHTALICPIYGFDVLDTRP